MRKPLRRFLPPLFGRRRFDADLDAELRFHLEVRADDLRRRGLSPAEARRVARLEFGSTERVREECREAGGLALADALVRNLRYAVRLLRRSPVFTTAAVLTLALCIGVNTAVFSLVDAVLLRPLPYPDPSRLLQVVSTYEGPEGRGLQEAVTGEVWEAVRPAGSFRAAVTAGLSASVNFAAGGRVESVRQQRVSAGFFSVLGVAPVAGREFTADEDRPGGAAVAVLSHALAARSFTPGSDVVGRTVTLRGEPHTVVGVMPAGFVTNSPAEIWTPLRPGTTGEGGGSNYAVIARLAPGATLAGARAEVARISGEVLRNMDLPRGARATLDLVPLQEALTRELRTPLLLLWVSVGLVLVIGCANIAGLLLARSGQRSREIATRLALGGGAPAVVAQLMTESLVLALLGGLAGILVGALALRALEPLAAQAFGVWQAVALDARVLAMSAGLSALTALVFGIFPAVQAARVDVRRGLVDSGARGVLGSARQWPRRLVVLAEVAVGVVLLVAAGLLVRTFLSLAAQAPGFDARGVVAAQVSLVDPRYRTAAAVSRLFEDSLAEMRNLPGVEAAAVGLTLPYERALNLGFKRLDGAGASDRASVVSACYVTADYFRVLRVPVVRGRGFEPPGRAQEPSVVVNEAFVRRFLPREPPLGLHLSLGGGPREIVGVVGDVQQQSGWGDFGPLAPVPTLYLPVSQMSDNGLPTIHTWFAPSWVVRSTRGPAELARGMQSALSRVDPLLPFIGFRSLDEVRSASLASQRVRAVLLAALAALAVLLTFVGVYGVIASGVAERRRELAVRLALGATAVRAVASAAAPGVALAAAGVALGTGLAALGAPLLRHLVWGVDIFDPGTFGLAAAVLLAAAGAGSLIPALRAASVDPASTLRGD